MAVVVTGGENLEPLEFEANDGPVADDPPPDEFLAELPQEFGGGSEDQTAVEAAEEDLAEEDDAEQELDVDEEDEGEEKQEEAPKQQGSRAQRRIQALNAKAKELEQQLSQRDKQYQQYLQQVQQQAAYQAQQLQERYEQQQQILQRQLELLSKREEKEEEASLSPMEKYQRDVQRKAAELARQQLEPELNELRQRWEQQQQEQLQAQQHAERQARYKKYSQATQQVRDKVVFDGYDKSDIEALADDTDEMILAMASAYGAEPNVIADKFAAWKNRLVKAELAKRTKKSGERIKKSRSVPAGVQASSHTASVNKWPTMGQLRKANFDSHVDWIAAGEPAIE